MVKSMHFGDFPGDPVAKIPSPQCRGLGAMPGHSHLSLKKWELWARAGGRKINSEISKYVKVAGSDSFSLLEK